jgi:hypothetical protein
MIGKVLVVKTHYRAVLHNDNVSEPRDKSRNYDILRIMKELPTNTDGQVAWRIGIGQDLDGALIVHVVVSEAICPFINADLMPEHSVIVFDRVCVICARIAPVRGILRHTSI